MAEAFQQFDGRYRVLNCGVGVQSSFILLAVIKGLLPPISCALFSDTGWESKATYQHLLWLAALSEQHGIPFQYVSKGDLREDYLRARRENGSGRFATIPLFTKAKDGTKGMLRRQCTRDYKIEPTTTFIRREILGLGFREHAPKEIVVDRWFGISADELERMKISTDKWQRFVYPLLGKHGDWMLPTSWTRRDCLNWLHSEYPDRKFPRSACLGCPYHSDEEWLRMLEEDPEGFADAEEFDRLIRHDLRTDRKALDSESFLHVARVPLREALKLPVIEGTEEAYIRKEGMRNECDGLCGV